MKEINENNIRRTIGGERIRAIVLIWASPLVHVSDPPLDNTYSGILAYFPTSATEDSAQDGALVLGFNWLKLNNIPIERSLHADSLRNNADHEDFIQSSHEEIQLNCKHITHVDNKSKMVAETVHSYRTSEIVPISQ